MGTADVASAGWQKLRLYYPLFFAILSARFSFIVLAGFFLTDFFCVIPLAIESLLYSVDE